MKIAKVYGSNKLIVQDGKICSTCCYPKVEPIYYCCCYLEPYPSEYTNWANNVFFPYRSIVKYQNKFYFCINTNGAFNIAPSNSTYWTLWDGCGRGELGSTPKLFRISGSYDYYFESTHSNYPCGRSPNITCGSYSVWNRYSGSFGGSVPYIPYPSTPGGGCVWSGQVPATYWMTQDADCDDLLQDPWQYEGDRTTGVSLTYDRGTNKHRVGVGFPMDGWPQVDLFMDGCSRTRGSFNGVIWENESTQYEYTGCPPDGWNRISTLVRFSANISWSLFHNV